MTASARKWPSDVRTTGGFRLTNKSAGWLGYIEGKPSIDFQRLLGSVTSMVPTEAVSIITAQKIVDNAFAGWSMTG